MRDWFSDQLAGHGIALRGGPRPGATLRLRCPQPACASKRGEALAVTIDSDGRGAAWTCHRCGWAGGARDGRTSERASAPRRAPREPAAVPTDPQTHPAWRGSRVITRDDPAGRYLCARGCALPHPEGDLRWHPALRHPCQHVGPALLGLVTDVLDASRCLTLHRTWITGDGSGRKAGVDPPRLLLKGHRKAGGVVRLWPDDAVTLGLGLAEGIETALTLARAFTPVWSCIDAGNLAAFPVLDGIESVTVAADHDPAGIRASDALAVRWAAAGCEVRRIVPPSPGADLNDLASDAIR